MSDLSWLNPTPHAIAVYASQPLSPVATQHSLPSGRYSLLGPDFHRLDRTSFAWRTHPTTSTASTSFASSNPAAPQGRRVFSVPEDRDGEDDGAGELSRVFRLLPEQLYRRHHRGVTLAAILPCSGESARWVGIASEIAIAVLFFSRARACRARRSSAGLHWRLQGSFSRPPSSCFPFSGWRSAHSRGRC